MSEWIQRPPAVANLLNPAALAVITAAAASEFERKSDEPMPYPYAFLVAPLVLHRATREALPNRVDSHLSRWLVNNEVLAAGFAARAKSLVPTVREGVRFGLRTGTLTVVDGALSSDLANRKPAAVGDIRALVQKSGFVGKWFAQADSSATTFALLGVTP